MIRLAVRADTDKIAEMLRHYREQSPLVCLLGCGETDTFNLLNNIFAGMGAIFVAEVGDKMVGMIIGFRNPNLWDRSIICMNELALWVEPEHRGGRHAWRLIKQYKDYCEALMDRGSIKYYTISKMTNSPDLNYERLGFEFLEGTYVCQPH